MAAGLNTFAGRAILIGLAIHAVLIPILFFSLLYIVKQSHEERFVNDVRKYSRFLADSFEIGGTVDSALLGSDGVYAELTEGDRRWLSALLADDSAQVYEEDFAFGEHGDHIYFLSMPVNMPGRQVVLKMGFNEQPTIEQVKTARQQLTVVLLLYLFVSIIALVLLSTRMTQPLRALQTASRNIANGQHSDQLRVDSQLTD